VTELATLLTSYHADDFFFALKCSGREGNRRRRLVRPESRRVKRFWGVPTFSIWGGVEGEGLVTR